MGENLLTRIDPGLFLRGILHGSQVVCPLHLLLIGIRIEGGDDKGKDHYHNDHHQRYHGYFILSQAAHTVLPEAHALPHDDLALFFLVRCRKKIFRIEF